MSFSAWAALAGLPLGGALGWSIDRLLLSWPAGHALWPPRGRSRIGKHALAARFRALPIAAAFTTGTVVLGATHPAPDWALWSQSILLWWLVFALAAIDLRSLLVDMRLVALGIALRWLYLLLWQRESLWDMGAGLLIGAGFFHIVGMFYEVLRGRTGLGEGDASVAGLIGAFVGWQGLLPLVALAALAGLLVSLPWLYGTRRPLSTPIPFVPFLCGAGLAVYIGQLHGWAVAFWPVASW